MWAATATVNVILSLVGKPSYYDVQGRTIRTARLPGALTYSVGQVKILVTCPIGQVVIFSDCSRF